MSELVNAARGIDRPAIGDCWNRIGVRGDGSCPELRQYVHCRNCPVYSAGAATLLDADVPASYCADRTAHFAEPVATEDGETQSVVIFRVASEWLALPTAVVVEVSNLLPIHSLPHRRNGVVLGLASVRGELLVCVSLRHVVGAEAFAAAGHERKDTAYKRLLYFAARRFALSVPLMKSMAFIGFIRGN